jgi:putative DNA primase/helicase
MTDVGNAERFILLHGKRVRYVQQSSRAGYWMYWTGKHWLKDSDAQVKRMVRDLVPLIITYCNTLADDDDTRSKWMSFAGKIQNGRRLFSALEHAQYDVRINVKPDIFDQRPLLLNCQNGTLDLSGTMPILREHRRQDYLTQMVPVPWIPDALSERWEQALKFWLPDQDVRAFVQKFVGSALTGLVLDDYLLVFEGVGGTGKSTFINGVLAVLGDYGKSANPSVIMRRRADQPSNDLMRLQGARLVVMLETDDGKSFDAETLKRVVSGDNEVARYLYQEHVEFAWTAKWLLGTNHAPEVPADDTGAWRRLMRVVFAHPVPDSIKDRMLRIDVKSDHDMQTAMLAWIVSGWALWRNEGLEPPASVRAATEQYRDDNRSVFDDWLETMVLERGIGPTATSQLYGSFKRFCEAQSDECEISSRSFGQRLRKVPGLSADKLDRNTRGWKGIRLPDEVIKLTSDGDGDVRDETKRS